VPVGVAACQVKSVPPKLSFCPSPLTCPALWSNENVYSGRPSKGTRLDPSCRFTVLRCPAKPPDEVYARD
jgi:hypothetical protein